MKFAPFAVLNVLLAASALAAQPGGGPAQVIHVQTDHAALSLVVADDARVYQTGFGKLASALTAALPGGNAAAQRECYPQWGDRYINEPALQATHADGNTSTDLVFVRQEKRSEADGVTVTRIELKDPAYPFHVTLCFRTYAAFDLFEQWTEITHEEPGPVYLDRFASSSPVFADGDVYVTQYHGSYPNEMNPDEEKLTPGIKVLDSKLDVRADYYRNPAFLLSRGAPAREDAGEVWAGCLQWPGSFQFAFENALGVTRALCGINPFASRYQLLPGKLFSTPVMTWAWSGSGVGTLSRNLHRWARQYIVRDGNIPHAIMLNNWEATHTGFDQQKLVSLFDRAKAIDMDMFLVDDGWFGGSKYSRDNDRAGLGDWEPSTHKLPGGIAFLSEQAKLRGLRLGMWIEPEMVNRKSTLFEQHPDWVMGQPHRSLDDNQNQRNQLVLDLSRPETKQYVLGAITGLLSKNPGISYLKWDCNRYVAQPGSNWLKADQQTNLPIDYGSALLDIMKQVATDFPRVEMMLCAGGGGRVDYGSMHHFCEFWPSDNTDPLRRATMQWDYSTFFPAITISGHVTRWGNRPLKFAFDVAMTGRLGIDMDLSKLSTADLAFAKKAVDLYKSELLPVVQFGDLYRVENPHLGPRSVIDYVSPDRSHAVLFLLQVKDAPPAPARPMGLDPARAYRIHEVNLPSGEASQTAEDDKVIEGATLMHGGVQSACARQCQSMVVTLTAE